MKPVSTALLLSDSELPKQGDIIGEKYRVEGTLGTGGMSAVFKVTHCVTKKSFALKWMLPSLTCEADAVQRFIREAEVAGRFEHPNVVEIYDFGRQGNSLYMVMEFLHGENLASRMDAGPLSPEQACAILLPTARAVAASHAAGVIHRDLKPQNIFLTCSPDGKLVPKVLDFGISKLTQLPGELQPAITAEGTIIGTPHYMAPEQICGQPVDERIDVYALGVILYEALTGEVPFPCNSYGDLILRITTQTPKPIRLLAPSTPQALVDVVARAMHRDRTCRYSSVTELANALEQCAASFGYTTTLPYTSTLRTVATRWTRTPLSSESPPVTAVRNRAMIRKVLRKYAIEFGVVFTLVAIGLALRSHPGVERASAPAAAPSPPSTAAPAGAAEARVAQSRAAAQLQLADAAVELAPKEEAPASAPSRAMTAAPELKASDSQRPPEAVRISAAAMRAYAGAKTTKRSPAVATTPAASSPQAPAIEASAPAPRPATRRTHALSDADF